MSVLSGLAGTTTTERIEGAEAGVAPGEHQDARPGDPSKVGEARPHWMGEHDYVRDLAAEESDRELADREYADERRKDRSAQGLDEEYAPV